MNSYYIDSNFTGSNEGTLSNPFNSIEKLVSNGISHPCNILIKKNSIFKPPYNVFWSSLINTSNQESSIDVYGVGNTPVIQQIDPNNSFSFKARNIKISNICFSSHKDNQGVFLLSVVASPDPSTYFANFNTSNLTFTNPSLSGRPRCAMIQGDSSLDYPTHKVGMKDTLCLNMHSGVQIMGNWQKGNEDPSKNLTDKLKMYGARIDGLTCINMPADGLIMSYCASQNPNKPPSDPLTSYVSNFYYRGYRGSAILDDSGNPTYSVPLWFVYSNNVLAEYLEVCGGQPQQKDQAAFDFDIRSKGCVIRYFYTHENDGGLLLITDNTNEAPNQGNLTNKQFFEDNGWCNRSNIIEYGLSFNDGARRGDGWTPWHAKFRILGRVFDNKARNITFIDTINMRDGSDDSTASVALAQTYYDFRASDGLSSNVLDISSCIFYYKFAKSASVGAFGDASLVSISNCGIFTEQLASNPMTLSADSAGPISAINYSNPMFEGIPNSSPSSFDAAKLIRMVRDSSYWSSGKGATVADIWGDFGSAIGWQQQY